MKNTISQTYHSFFSKIVKGPIHPIIGNYQVIIYYFIGIKFSCDFDIPSYYIDKKKHTL